MNESSLLRKSSLFFQYAFEFFAYPRVTQLSRGVLVCLCFVFFLVRGAMDAAVLS